MRHANQPFTNLQLELLRLFSRQLSEQDLLEIRKLLTGYFSGKVINEADSIWDKKGWNRDDENNFLQSHERASS